jgi:hypothetical protein
MKFARNAAIIAAAASLPAQAIAATPVTTAFEQLRAGAEVEEENDQFGRFSRYGVPIVIVVVVIIGVFFIFDSNKDKGGNGLPTSP